MKKELPKISIVDNDPIIDSKLEEVLKEMLPCEISYYKTFKGYMSSSVYPQLVMIDPALFPRETGAIQGLETVIMRTPEDRVVERPFVISVSNESFFNYELKQINNLGIMKFLDKPPQGGDLDAFEVDLREMVKDLINKNVFCFETPIAVYGSGIVAAELVKELLNMKLDVHWYGHALANKKFVYPYISDSQEEIDRLVEAANSAGLNQHQIDLLINKFQNNAPPPNYIGYTELMRLRDFPALSGAHCYYELGRIFLENPGFIVFASSLPGRVKITGSTDRSNPEHVKELFKQTLPRLKNLLDNISKNSDATLINISNPPEANCLYAASQGISHYKLLGGVPDTFRLTKMFDGKLKPVLLGEHANLIFDPRLCKVNSMTFAQILKLRDKSFYEEWAKKQSAVGEKNLDRSDENSDLIVKWINEELQRWGVETMVAFAEAGREIPYTDAAHAVARGIFDTLHFKRPYFAGYFPRFDAYMLGKPLKVDYTNLSFHQPDEPDEIYEQVIEERREDLERIARGQHELLNLAKSL